MNTILKIAAYSVSAALSAAASVVGILYVAGHLKATTNTDAPTTSPVVSAPTGVPRVQTVPVALAVQTAKLDASVLIDGQNVKPVGGQSIAVASGARFYVKLRPSHDGTVEVFNINSAGERSVVWSGIVKANQPTVTPRMRVEGVRGYERLNLRFTPTQGQGVPVGRSAHTSLAFLHY
jgi:hypothetical protein